MPGFPSLYSSHFIYSFYDGCLVPSTPTSPSSKHPGTSHRKVLTYFLGMCRAWGSQVVGHAWEGGGAGARVIRCAFQKGSCHALPHLLQRLIPSGLLECQRLPWVPDRDHKCASASPSRLITRRRVPRGRGLRGDEALISASHPSRDPRGSKRQGSGPL